MKIVIISHACDLYGASRSLLRIAQRLKAGGHEPTVVLPGGGPLRDALHEAGIASVEHPWLAVVDRASFRSLRGILRLLLSGPVSGIFLLRLFQRLEPDVVHTNSSVAVSGGVAARLCGIPHVWHVRECYDDFQIFWKFHRRFMLAFADALPCISRAVAAQFGSAAKARVLHNGYPREEFAGVTDVRRARVMGKLGDSPGPRVVLMGRIKLLRKGQDTFVRAAALLRDIHPSARFVIVGAPFPGNEDHLEKLGQLADELGVGGSVVFAGEIPDAPAVFDVCDIAVMASGTPEPLGGVTIEAMAMGRPVVGTDIGGTSEIIVDEQTGFLVPPNDAPALAAALSRLLDDEALRRRMGDAGRARYLEHFEFEPFYAQLTRLYSELVRP